ncbi:MAG: lytic transglycosylase domain-containing protein [Bosea sp. (in: a-proteobacteria)]
MFLFRTSGPAQPTPANPVMDAIRQGADRTGTNFDYLVKTAQRESALDPEAKARTSSATGLFQFIEQTWLGMVRNEGPKHGLADASKAIVQGSDGRLSVPDAKRRDEIMALRRDPQVASTMAGAFTQRNRDQLGTALGREPSGGELYIAHVLGARGAQELIGAADKSPTRIAARDFPEAAAANRNIFFDKAGKARSVADVYQVLSAQHADITTVTGTRASETSGPVRKGLTGLFSTEGSRKPVSDAVAALWTGQRGARLQLASTEPSQRFFPNSDGVRGADGPALPAEATRLVEAPLPPVRPSGLAETPGDRNAAVRREPRAKPMDLMGYLRSGVLR